MLLIPIANHSLLKGRKMARITVEDIPVLDDLHEEEIKGIFGGARKRKKKRRKAGLKTKISRAKKRLAKLKKKMKKRSLFKGFKRRQKLHRKKRKRFKKR